MELPGQIKQTEQQLRLLVPGIMLPLVVIVAQLNYLLMAFKKDLISLLDECENGKIYGMLNVQYTISCVQIGFFHLVRVSIY